MSDRELLEWAAKAVGKPGVHQNWKDECGNLSQGIAVNGAPGRLWWNPLTDDGDALRLAVDLRLTISYERYDDTDYVVATPPHTHQGYDCAVDQDPRSATRRAIGRAAAAVGKALP